MQFKRWQIKIITLLLCYIIPIGTLIIEGFLRCSGYIILIYTLDIGFYTYLNYRCNQWELSWLPLRYIYTAAFLIVSVWKVVTAEYYFNYAKMDYILLIIAAFLLFVLTRLLYKVLLGMKKPTNTVQLSFPYRNGNYLITDAGDGKCSSLLNYHYKSIVHGAHNTQETMRFAVDIVKMNSVGRTARTLLRSRIEDYYSYGETLYSPMEGIVVRAVDGITDNTPFPGIRKMNYSLGNRVIIKKDDFYLVLGHFKNGTIKVQEGDLVKAGDVLGNSGCTGLSPRPELHMQLIRAASDDCWSGTGIPFVFNEVYPIKNMVLSR